MIERQSGLVLVEALWFGSVRLHHLLLDRSGGMGHTHVRMDAWMDATGYYE